MARRRTVLFAAAAVGTAGAVGATLLRGRRRQRRAHPVLEGGPLLIAHRGGAGLAPENTLAAFVPAIREWGADMVELDVRASADGHVVVIHDPTVDRTTDGSGLVSSFSLEELQALDAGYRFTTDGGATHPFRGCGVRIPTLAEVFEALPRTRFTIEVKDGAAQRPMFDLIERLGIAHRVIAAGMFDRDRTLFHRHRGAVSGSTEQARAWSLARVLRLERLAGAPFDVLQLPEMHDGRRIVSRAMIRALHRQGIPLHVWTVNDPADMERMLDWGADGLVTDRPDLLGKVLHRRNGRPLAPGHDASTPA